jgi:hypothetical protein
MHWKLCIAALLLLGTAAAGSQELEPRAYANTPVGMNFLLAGVGYLDGSVLTDAATQLEQTEVQSALPLLGYARALDVFGKSGKVELIAPFGCLEGSTLYRGQKYERDVCGWGDPALKFSVNFFGAPALSLREMATWQQDLIVGAGVRVLMPLGEYDGDKLLNPGANRWSLKPEIGVSKALGRFTLELIGAAVLFSENDDFYGHVEREQDPVYSLQGHLIYSFRGGAWLAFDATGYAGGRTTTNGVRGDDLQRNSRVGATLAWPLDQRNSLKLNLSSGVSARSGGNYDALTIAWQHRWGGGL